LYNTSTLFDEDEMTTHDLKATIRQRYGEAARHATSGAQSSCCRSSCCGGVAEEDPITSNLYTEAETATLPKEAVLASLGCGNPTALAELHEGEVVLDLGSGGGIDVLLSAKRVGPTGKAYGLDMTDEMLALAGENQRKAGVENVEFLKGDIEDIPLPDASVDVIISNCVINLSADKRKVIAEAFRVLKPGGRFAVSDVVIRGDIPADVRSSMELWVGCVAGALTEQEFHSFLWETGFEKIDIEPTRVYEFEDAKAFLTGAGLDTEVLAREVGGRVMGAFIRGTKPAAGATELNAVPAGLARACCGPDCCA
jgi:arsenite methyltransferase